MGGAHTSAPPGVGMSRLGGRVVATTRGPGPSDRLVRGLRSEGATVRVWPTLRFTASGERRALADAADRIDEYDWVVFTSARGIRPIAELATSPPRRARVAVVGPATAKALEAWGWKASLMGRGGAAALGRGLAEDHDLDGARILFPAASRAQTTLEDALTSVGAIIHRIEAYRTILHPPDGARVRDDLERGVDLVTFTSPSAIEALESALTSDWPGALARCGVVAIGHTTADAARAAGLRSVAVARKPSLHALVDACVTFFVSPGS